MNKTIFPGLFLALLFVLLPATSAIDIAAPDNNAYDTGANVSFTYYNDVQNATSCTLNIPPQSLPDQTIQNGLNSFIVQNIDEGKYNWSITCTNATTSKSTTTRKLTIDQTKPTLQLQATAGEQLSVDVLVADVTPNVTCTYASDGLSDTQTFATGAHKITTYTQSAGQHTLVVTCTDLAGNTASKNASYEIVPNDYLILTPNKASYGLGETILLTIDAPENASVTVDICPDQQGFVQCVSPLIVPGFPQTVQLPLNNQSGAYIVEGIMSANSVIINNTRYTVENTIGLALEMNKVPRLNEQFELVADVYGAMGAVTYTWELHNGSTYTSTNPKRGVIPKTPGVKTETLTITDAAGNTKTTSVTYAVEESILVTITVRDANGVLQGAIVQESDEDTFLTTPKSGQVQMRLNLGTNKLYAAMDGYETLIREVLITENTTAVTLTLGETTQAFTVMIDEPAVEERFASTATIPVKFTTRGITSGTCDLFMALDTETFLEAKGSLQITKDGQQGFGLSELAVGRYAYSVECTQEATIINTPKRYFNVDAVAEQAIVQDYVADPNGEQQLLENALTHLRSLGSKEQQLVTALELDTHVNRARKQAGQLNRDIFDMQYKNELTASEIAAEQDRLRKELAKLMQETVVNVEIKDQRTLVEYITEEEIQSLIDEHGDALDLPSGSAGFLAEAQQSYTMKTALYRAQLTYADGRTQIVAAVAKEFSYGKDAADQGNAGEYLLEIVPKTVAKTAADLVIVTEDADILIDDPVVKFPAGKQIVYYVQKELSLSELEGVRTLLVPRIVEGNAITGYAFFGEKELRGLADSYGISFSLLVAILIAAYLTYYFGLIDRVKYLFYAGGPKTKMHYMRVLLNDVHDNLQANNYEKALMIYKEIKLTYDQLEIPAKNELFEEITAVCAELDTSFMKQLVVKMDAALKEDNLEEALEYYARIEATYDRLPPAEQQQVQDMVVGLGRRLGVSA